MKKSASRSIALLACTSFAALVAGVANASTTFESYTTAWSVQDYPAPQGVVLWHTPSTCTAGQLMFNQGESQERNNRLTAMIIAAKTANLKMNIEYNVVGSSCIISDFGIIGS